MPADRIIEHYFAKRLRSTYEIKLFGKRPVGNDQTWTRADLDNSAPCSVVILQAEL